MKKEIKKINKGGRFTVLEMTVSFCATEPLRRGWQDKNKYTSTQTDFRTKKEEKVTRHWKLKMPTSICFWHKYVIAERKDKGASLSCPLR